MSYLQSIQIHTQKGGFIESDLEKTGNTFSISRSVVKYSSSKEGEAVFKTLASDCTSAVEAFNTLYDQTVKELNKYDPDDRITKINNPCNCQYITHLEQQEIVGDEVDVCINE